MTLFTKTIPGFFGIKTVLKLNSVRMCSGFRNVCFGSHLIKPYIGWVDERGRVGAKVGDQSRSLSAHSNLQYTKACTSTLHGRLEVGTGETSRQY
jgi:hypothetical protein